MKQLHCINQFT